MRARLLGLGGLQAAATTIMPDDLHVADKLHVCTATVAIISGRRRREDWYRSPLQYWQALCYCVCYFLVSNKNFGMLQGMFFECGEANCICTYARVQQLEWYDGTIDLWYCRLLWYEWILRCCNSWFGKLLNVFIDVALGDLMCFIT